MQAVRKAVPYADASMHIATAGSPAGQRSVMNWAGQSFYEAGSADRIRFLSRNVRTALSGG